MCASSAGCELLDVGAVGRSVEHVAALVRIVLEVVERERYAGDELADAAGDAEHRDRRRRAWRRNAALADRLDVETSRTPSAHGWKSSERVARADRSAGEARCRCAPY